MLKHLYSKKGFTMVELIVVIAIIGILLGLIVPNMLGAGKPQEAASKAESFYRAIQNIFINYKSDNTGLSATGAPAMESGYYKLPEDPPDSDPDNDVYAKDGEYLLVYATATPQDDFTDVKVALVTDGNKPEENYRLGLTATSDPDLLKKINDQTAGDDYGYYYALVDSQCRVVECYWSQMDFDTVFSAYEADHVSGSIIYTASDYVGNYCVGSFPTQVSVTGAKMFMTDVT